MASRSHIADPVLVRVAGTVAHGSNLDLARAIWREVPARTEDEPNVPGGAHVACAWRTRHSDLPASSQNNPGWT